MRRRPLAHQPVEGKSVEQGAQRQRVLLGPCPWRFLHRRGVAEHDAGGRHESDHGALVVGAGDVPKRQAAMPGSLGDRRTQLVRRHAVARFRVPTIRVLMECLALMNSERSHAGGQEASGVVGHVQVAAKAYLAALAPVAQPFRLSEQMLRDALVGRATQLNGHHAAAA